MMSAAVNSCPGKIVRDAKPCVDELEIAFQALRREAPSRIVVRDARAAQQKITHHLQLQCAIGIVKPEQIVGEVGMIGRQARDARCRTWR